ncbi:hypothetical protein D3C86_1683380 [compost metagenome]
MRATSAASDTFIPSTAYWLACNEARAASFVRRARPQRSISQLAVSPYCHKLYGAGPLPCSSEAVPKGSVPLAASGFGSGSPVNRRIPFALAISRNPDTPAAAWGSATDPAMPTCARLCSTLAAAAFRLKFCAAASRSRRLRTGSPKNVHQSGENSSADTAGWSGAPR